MLPELPPAILDALLAARYRSEDPAAAIEALCAQHPDFAPAIRAHAAADTPASRAVVLPTAPPTSASRVPEQPTQIGPYRILSTLGEGGMGSVYLAEQSTPVKRKVALKLIKLGMDSKAVVARFEQERQALALMAHDGIAKVYDCGMSERGQPFFVMELVKGIPLNEFCEQNRLSLPDRLQLMRQVCAAVQHAHQKGVVHRDLKPSNVLVSDDSGKPMVKIIDFGLAKAMGQRLVEATFFTQAGQIVGTPEYMAPEQADPTNADIDTRADIYSLGVMLYEVLVGQLPFSAEDLRQAGLLGMQKMLREVDPPKPSTKLSSAENASTAIAGARRMSVAALWRALKNELDWVVLKAMEKDRGRRYETANVLSADLQRFLDHEPLVAGPPSAAYRFKKLMRRYRGQVLAGCTVMMTALGGAVVAVTYAVAAANNEVLANQKAEVAVALVRSLEETFDYFDFLLANPDPSRSGGYTGIETYVLDQAMVSLRAIPMTQAQVRARVALWLGTRLLDAGNLGDAERVLDTALAAALAQDDPRTQALTQAERGRLFMLRESPECVPLLEHALTVLREDTDHPSRAWRTELMLGLALPKDQRSEAVLLALAERLEKVPHVAASAVCLEALLALARHQARSDRRKVARGALARAEVVLAGIKEPLPAQRVAVDRGRAMLAATMGEHATAIALLRESVVRLGAIHRDDKHPVVLAARKDLFDALFGASELPEAAALGSDLLIAFSSMQDALSGDLDEVRTVQAKVLIGLKRPKEALTLCHQCWEYLHLRAAREKRGIDGSGAGNALLLLGVAEAECGDLDAAEATFQDAIGHFERIPPSDPQPRNCYVGQARLALARARWRRGQHDSAIATATDAIGELWWATPILPDDYLDCLQELSQWLDVRTPQYEQLVRDELDRLRPRIDKLATEGTPDSPLRLARHSLVVGLLAAWSGQRVEAISALERAVALLEDAIGPQHRQTRSATAALAAVRAGRKPARTPR